MTLICRLIGHRRSLKRARRVTDGWVSHCRFCGERLIRRGPKAWQPEAIAMSGGDPDVPLPLFDREHC